MIQKLIEIKELKGKTKLISGLHIGAGNDEIHIGGIDNPVIKNPLNDEPYIPGSSLKGKIRTLLEWYLGTFGINNKGEGTPHFVKEGDGDEITLIFGNGSAEQNYHGGPTRVSFNDCPLSKESLKKMIEKNALTEEKIEVSINRLSGTASKSGPRNIERVPAGAEFDFSLSYLVFNDIDKQNFKYLILGLKLLELTALGGSGSRGYGKIKFEFENNVSIENFTTKLESDDNGSNVYILKDLKDIEQEIKK
ncbi:MAG: type III-A CRISPR-associated RAMP protein Csm3 [Candidatus Acididesulfobacter guangdongensis]|uniref:CRISPR system Cms endoribonuclease Csm3 n=1 Tax=Acididesulfobacter guangdongensis TaxID=2597225 RepID=A0A519BIS4_ACIG2|nr:MAG: type III-A CRISPR-associated RAMP protein Csm3 [Candidatus Acididesulfobacter guangdongensis]